jgi:hypothetical protein
VLLGDELKGIVLVEEIAAFYIISTTFCATLSTSSCVLSETLRSIKLSRFVLNRSQAMGSLVSEDRSFSFGDPPIERITGVWSLEI